MDRKVRFGERARRSGKIIGVNVVMKKPLIKPSPKVNIVISKNPQKFENTTGHGTFVEHLNNGDKNAKWVKKQIRKRCADYKNREIYPISIATGNRVCDIMCEAFAIGFGGRVITPKKWLRLKNSGLKLDNIMAYGILRGVGPIIKQVPNYFYVDHGYFNSSRYKKQIFSGYYRICHNSMWHDGSENYPSDRFDNLNVKIKKWRKNGNQIVIIPPNEPMAKHLGITNWLDHIILKLRKYTDRQLVISRKSNLPTTNPPLMSKYEQDIEKLPLNLAMNNAWAVVTDHSNAAIESIINGIPAVITNSQRRLGSIKNIENPTMNRDFLKNLAYQQWTIEEIISGQAKEHFPMISIAQQQ